MGLVFLLACGGSASDEKEELNIFVLTEGQDSVLTPYFKIVHALQNDEFDKTRGYAKLLSAASVENGVMLALTRMGTLMSESSTSYNQRVILEQMGMVIPLYIEQNALNNYLIYKFKCINEFDAKEVVWYDLSKKTTNPFIGKNSNECIELVETIKPVLKR